MQVDFTMRPDDPASSMTKREYIATMLFSSLVSLPGRVPDQIFARLAVDGANALITEINEVSMEIQNAIGVAHSTLG